MKNFVPAFIRQQITTSEMMQNVKNYLAFVLFSPFFFAGQLQAIVSSSAYPQQVRSIFGK
jgi:hypothetical protein